MILLLLEKDQHGISASIYLKRANHKVLVIGKDGGALEKTKAIDNYYGFANTITGKELLQEGLKQAERLGILLQTDEVISIEKEQHFKIETRNNSYQAKTIILATGTNRNKPNIKGIKELEGKGVSYCAICDAFFYRNKKVGVLGSRRLCHKRSKNAITNSRIGYHFNK